ncbi:hypothetical protein VPH80_002420 [Vibrio parahaemolyticus]|uniref:LICD family protein n=1 Tax=Vibrio parahaemolyticus TaxID=670 RepID=A0A5Q5AWS2_VIBPH|nr:MULTISPECIES: hypothetical protein [Vibrio]EGQ7903450.1 hypothetical protein [Vibrio alginolyticus]EIJ0963307.1 hypothetical protein [Vibrio parahaemolyticus]EJO2022769.1 hypothetical protein [Vibrio parahaemolyticus]EKA5859811.1 hypothetical protein [Vibrio alginolyticus]EMC9923235.1 hypothetical protein [Vibrio parahaemolyticus]
MLDKLKYKVKTQIIGFSTKVSFLDLAIMKIRKYRKSKRVNPNKSEHAESVLQLIKNSNLKVFPMFGTLLSIYRDGKFIYADDYDFALMEGQQLDIEVINKMNHFGAVLVAFSIVGDDLVELSFDFNGVRIDFFQLDYSKEKVTHRCPNFRKERPDIDFSKLIKKKYQTYFSVDYVLFELEFNQSWGVYIPTDCEKIFERHYGLDWRTPKMSNFIDFSNYDFKELDSYNVCGEQGLLIHELETKFNNLN